MNIIKQYHSHYAVQFNSVQFSSVAQLCPTLCDPMDCSTLGLPVHHQLLEPSQTHVHRVGFSSHLQSFPASGSFPMSRFFTSGGQSIGVSASSISPSSDYSGLISFRIDWFVLLTVQGTIKSLLQHHSSKASVL